MREARIARSYGRNDHSRYRVVWVRGQRTWIDSEMDCRARAAAAATTYDADALDLPPQLIHTRELSREHVIQRGPLSTRQRTRRFLLHQASLALLPQRSGMTPELRRRASRTRAVRASSKPIQRKNVIGAVETRSPTRMQPLLREEGVYVHSGRPSVPPTSGASDNPLFRPGRLLLEWHPVLFAPTHASKDKTGRLHQRSGMTPELLELISET